LRVGKLFIVLLTFISCINPQDSTEIDFGQLQKINPLIDETGWEVIKSDRWTNIIEYTLTKKNKDTTCLLMFRKFLHDSIFNPGSDSYGLVFFTKKFRDSEFGYVVSFASDTNYYYKYPLQKPDSMIFIVGKYLYMAYYYKLSKGQRSYYFAHKDSLRKIRGDDLPELPENN
jgi:hypothetical protein